jgi:hypothetical protein
MCTIWNAEGHIMATIPQANGLYCLVNSNKPNCMELVNVVAGKMSISEAHFKLGHISHDVISSRWITRINLDMDLKPKFCEPCVKVKSARHLFSKKSETCATKYGEQVHWDLWGPASVKSLNGNYYVTVQIDDHTYKN